MGIIDFLQARQCRNPFCLHLLHGPWCNHPGSSARKYSKRWERAEARRIKQWKKDHPEERKQLTRTTYAYWVRGKEFAELAALSIASIKRFDRFMVDRRFMVITDEASTNWAVPAGVELHCLEPGRPAMVANLDAQIYALANTPYGERVLFLDADTICLKPFPWTDADLHVTYRTEVNGDPLMAKQQPYNYGVLGVNVTPATIEAFYWLRARILRMNPERQAWYGNQLALADLLGQPNGGKKRRIRWTLQDEGTPLSVCELPCDVWNYSPDTVDEDVKGKGILHFKGGRKDLIEAYTRAAA